MDETGENYIFATGAPGSKWSAMLRTLSYNIRINNSDENEEDTFQVKLFSNLTNTEKTLAWHRGAYWGPYHKYGHKFDMLDKLSKDEIIHELNLPFKEPGGIKVIKSHWFSYHLEFLAETFPKAKILTVYLPDDVCFDWWKVIGGWNIHYPVYTWYENDDRMRDRIKEENAHITRFFARRKRFLDRYFNINHLYFDLGLPTAFKEIDTETLGEFVDENKLTINDDRFTELASSRISKTLLTVYNQDLDIVMTPETDYFMNKLVDPGPDGNFINDIRAYRYLENKNDKGQ